MSAFKSGLLKSPTNLEFYECFEKGSLKNFQLGIFSSSQVHFTAPLPPTVQSSSHLVRGKLCSVRSRQRELTERMSKYS